LIRRTGKGKSGWDIGDNRDKGAEGVFFLKGIHHISPEGCNHLDVRLSA